MVREMPNRVGALEAREPTTWQSRHGRVGESLMRDRSKPRKCYALGGVRPGPGDDRTPTAKFAGGEGIVRLPWVNSRPEGRIMLFRIVGTDTATQEHVEIHWDAPSREAAERFATEKGIAVCNVAPIGSDIPAVRPQTVAKNVMLPIVVSIAVLGAIGIVMYARAERAVSEQTKATFERIKNQLPSPTYSTTYSPAATNLTLTNFGRIRTGMSRYDVGEILGFGWKTVAENEIGQGTDFHVTTEAIEWQDGSRIVHCMFQNGKLVQKAQFGLE